MHRAVCSDWYLIVPCSAALLVQASPDDATLAADVSETAAALRQWVDTAADKDYLLLHARVEASASRWAGRWCSSSIAATAHGLFRNISTSPQMAAARFRFGVWVLNPKP